MTSTINIGAKVDAYFVATWGVVTPEHDGLDEAIDGFVADAKAWVAGDMIRKAQQTLDAETDQRIRLREVKSTTQRGPVVTWDVDDEDYASTYWGEVREAFADDFVTDAEWFDSVLAAWGLRVARIDESRFGQVLVLGDA